MSFSSHISNVCRFFSCSGIQFPPSECLPKLNLNQTSTATLLGTATFNGTLPTNVNQRLNGTAPGASLALGGSGGLGSNSTNRTSADGGKQGTETVLGPIPTGADGTNKSTNEGSSPSNLVGIITGISGAIAVLLVLVGVVVFTMRRRNRRQGSERSTSDGERFNHQGESSNPPTSVTPTQVVMDQDELYPPQYTPVSEPFERSLNLQQRRGSINVGFGPSVQVQSLQHEKPMHEMTSQVASKEKTKDSIEVFGMST
jgi:hypothetical protein